MSKQRYQILSPIRVGGKRRADGTVLLTEEEAEQLREVKAVRGPVGETASAPVDAPPASTEASTGSEPSTMEAIAQSIGGRALAALADAGLTTPDAIFAKTDDELEALPGVGRSTVAKLSALRPAA